MDLVVWSQICCRWFGNIPCLFKYSCTCSHVFLLWTVCTGTRLPEVSVVEKVFDVITTYPVRSYHHPHQPVLFHGGLQVPVSSLSVHHYELWLHLPAALSPFLVPCLHQRSEATQNCETWNLQKQRSLKFKYNISLWKRLISCLPWQSRDISMCSAFCIFFKTKSLYFYDKLLGLLVFESPKLPENSLLIIRA